MTFVNENQVFECACVMCMPNIIMLYRISNLEAEFKMNGINVSDSIKSIIENQKNNSNAFLKEWWSVQKNLLSQNSKLSNRYPPSVVK